MISLNENQLKDNISQTCSADLLTGHIGGAAVLVKQNGKTIYKDFFGSAGEGREINEKTLFRLASMTKPITALTKPAKKQADYPKFSKRLVLRLLERGK